MFPARFIALASLALCVAACDSSLARIGVDQHEQLVLEWREGRLERLKAEDGFLNLSGLFWLGQGKFSFGSDASNDIRFPAVAAARIGTLEVTENGVVMVTDEGVDVRYEGIPVSSLLLSDDTTDNPITITHRSLAWVIINREGRYAVRLRDFNNPALESFPPLEYFNISRDYRVEAVLHAYEQPKIVQVNTVIEGLGWEPESPGVLRFELNGTVYELEAYASGERLFLVFGDQTNGRETYPAGRFLYAEAPDEKARTVLDFNMSYSPPCAFNDFSTCPVATPRNRLKTAIVAGEKYTPTDKTDHLADRRR